VCADCTHLTLPYLTLPYRALPYTYLTYMQEYGHKVDVEMQVEIMEDVAELRQMMPEKLELKRLKYLEKVAKYTRKLAECKMDLAEAEARYQESLSGRGACAAVEVA